MTANAHGYNDIGNTYIEVDLSEQHMYFYQNGEDIFESDIVSGDMRYSDRQTPAVFIHFIIRRVRMCSEVNSWQTVNTNMNSR